MRDRSVFIGNLDPSGVLALGTPALVEEKTRERLGGGGVVAQKTPCMLRAYPVSST